MKKTVIATAFLFLSSLFMVPAVFAADQESGAQGQAAPQQTGQEQYQGQFQQQKSSLILTDHLIGTELRNQNDETIGEIENVLVDFKTGQVGYVLVAGSGVMGVAEEQYIVPFSAMRAEVPVDEVGEGTPALREMVYILTTEQDQLKQVEGDIETALTDEQLTEVDEYYGVSPYWEEEGMFEEGVVEEDGAIEGNGAVEENEVIVE